MSEPDPQRFANLVDFLRIEHSEQIEELCAGVYDDAVVEVSLLELERQLPDVFDDLVSNPDIVRGWFDDALNNLEALTERFFQSEELRFSSGPLNHPFPEGGEEVAVAFTDPPDHLKEDIGAPRGRLFGRMVAFEGICQQRSDPKPRLLSAVYECQRCGHQHQIDCSDTFDLDNSVPSQCAGCERKGPFKQLRSEDVRREYQQLKIQERPGQARNSSNPREILCNALGSHLVDEAGPGDRVTVVGVVREKTDNDSTIQDTRLEVLGVAPEEQQFEEIELDDEDLEQIQALAERQDLYETIQRSVAPGIFGYENVKLGIAMQLFGGVTSEHYQNRKRGEIHLMCIGDPGTGKSKLLSYARQIAPRGVAASGTASTAVGLTASATREKIGREEQWTLSAGAAALADQGLLTVDELDKFEENEQRSLNEALSEGEMTVNKANIRTTVRSRCSALMAANPREGRFDPEDTYREQFDMPPDLLNRCDLIFTFRDEPNAETDRQIAEKVLEPHAARDAATADGGEPVAVDENGVVNPELFRKYVAFARRSYEPALNPEAMNRLQDFYETIRSELSHDKIPMNARQLDGGRRLTQAFARADLSDVATEEHAERAIDLLMSSLSNFGFDIDRLEIAGSRDSQEKLVADTTEIIQNLEGETGAQKSRVLGELGKRGHGQKRSEETIETLKRNGTIYEPESGMLRTS